MGLKDKYVVLQSKSLFSKRSSLALQKQETNLKDLGEVKDSKFPQNFVLHNHSKNTKDKEKKLNKNVFDFAILMRPNILFIELLFYDFID